VRGSHAVLKNVMPQGERGCVIPRHREAAPGTLRSALKIADVWPEEFKDGLSGKMRFDKLDTAVNITT
jgi:HicA toxin of bacterial toxin-antitoxin,